LPAGYADVASALQASQTRLLKLYYAQGQLCDWWAAPKGTLRSWNASSALRALNKAVSAAADWNGPADSAD